jgi:hypothetical protein
MIALALPAMGAQPTTDVHLSTDSGSNLYAASAFAHGLRHGYEEGFHDADRDLHLSAFSLDEMVIPKPKKVMGYQPEFGPKDSFRKGYELGYRLGYADSLKGIAFRMHAPAVNVVAAPDRDFDRGVQYGYVSPTALCSGTPLYCAGVQAGRALARTVEPATQVASAK